MESCVHVCYEVILESMEHEKLHLFVGYKWRPVKNLFKQWQKFSFSWYISLKGFASQRGLAFLFFTFYEFEKIQLPKAALLFFFYLPIHLVWCLDPLGCSWFWGKKEGDERWEKGGMGHVSLLVPEASALPASCGEKGVGYFHWFGVKRCFSKGKCVYRISVLLL